MENFGKLIIVAGIVLIVVGAAISVLPKIPFIGKLPGDITIKKGHFTFYFPIATSILVSAILTILFRIFKK
ncbi:MAG: DUF2905 domain-containing protein [Elusimicrobia bacterium]|nr:DUF2905 domain-containing protein [Elusimicrobiota bacterium]